MRPAEIVTLVGENGSGKSVSALSIVRVVPYHGHPSLVTGLLALDGKKMTNGRPTVYVCEPYSCQSPVTEHEALREQLRAP